MDSTTAPLWLGIDFGTCTTSAALLIGEEAHSVPLHDRDCYIPTAVYVKEDGEILVGFEAQNMRNFCPERYRDNFKLEIGRVTEVTIGSQTIIWQSLVAAVLRYVKEQAEKQYYNGRPLSHAVLTVPAIYTENRIEIMLQAAEEAGFKRENLRILHEPEAAALYYQYILGKNNLAVIDSQHRCTLVYDLGGGTFDPALIERSGNASYKVLQALDGTQGVGIECGGTFFDKLIGLDILKKHPQLEKLINDNIESEDAQICLEASRRLYSLNDFVTEVKIQLSNPHKQSIKQPIPPDYTEVCELSRDEFEELISPLLDKTIDCCKTMVEQQDACTWQDIGQIMLVGGSCNIPLVKQKLEEMCRECSNHPIKIFWQHYENQQTVSFNAQNAVSLGAAVVHAVEAGQTNFSWANQLQVAKAAATQAAKIAAQFAKEAHDFMRHKIGEFSQSEVGKKAADLGEGAYKKARQIGNTLISFFKK